MNTSTPHPEEPVSASSADATSSATPDGAASAAASSSTSGEASAPSQTSLATQLADLEARHAEVSDAYLRAKAEAENTRRRADEEISKARKFAVESFADSLLPVKDSLEAAIALPNATSSR